MSHQSLSLAIHTALLATALTHLPLVAAEQESVLRTVKVKAAGENPQTYNPVISKGATKSDAPLRDVPQTINVINAEVMRDQGATSIQDVLKNVPGVGFSHGDGQRDQVTIRGFTAIADQFVDGFRDDALYFRDLSNIESIEVIKGPAAVLYGRGSSGGLINRVTKKPGIDITQLTLSYGSWADKRGEFDVARKGETISWRVTGAMQDADSYRDEQFLERTAFAPSVLIDINDDSSLLLQADYLQDERVTDFGIPAYRGEPVHVDPSTYYGAGNGSKVDTSMSRVESFKADYRLDFSPELALRNGLRYYHYNLDRNNTLSGTVNETQGTVSLNRTQFDRNEFGFFNQTEITHKFHVAGFQHEVLYGVEFGRQKKDQVNKSRTGVATVSLFDPVLPDLPLVVNVAPGTDNLAVVNTAAAYVQDQAQLSEHWKALIGIRFDRFKQETRERRAGQSDLERTDNAWSPRVGFVYQPDTVQSYYISVSRSFQPSGESFALAANNADIEPEETTNQEIGAKYEFWDGRLSVTASLFRLERTDIKATNPATNTLINVGEQRTDGLELTAAGDLGDDWHVIAGYAYLDANVTKSVAVDAGQLVDGNRATLTPRHSANIWLTHSFGDRYGVGVGANYVGDRMANPGNTVTLPAYTTADAAAWAHFGKVDLQLNLRNLFDREHIVSGHGSSPNLNLPGAPRNATLTARLNF